MARVQNIDTIAPYTCTSGCSIHSVVERAIFHYGNIVIIGWILSGLLPLPVEGFSGPIWFASSPLVFICCMWGWAFSSLTACYCLLLDLYTCIQILWTWCSWNSRILGSCGHHVWNHFSWAFCSLLLPQQDFLAV